EGRDIGVSREEFQRGVPAPPAPAPPPPAPPVPALVPTPTPDTGHLLLAGGSEFIPLGARAYQHAPRIVVAPRFTPPPPPPRGPPVSGAGAGARARLSVGAPGASGGGSFLTAGSLSVIAGLGAGLELGHVEPTVTTPDLTPAASFWAAGPLVEAFAALEERFGR